MRRAFLFLAVVPAFLFAKKGTYEEETSPKAPWFTGPLICPSANTVEEGSYNIEPFFYATKNPALYDNNWKAQTIPTQWMIGVEPFIWVGLTNWCDIEFQLSAANWDHNQQGGGAWTLRDSLIQFEFQLWRDEWPSQSWLPSIKLAISELLPLGKYRNLNPSKLAADQGGLGSWTTGLQLVFGKIWLFSKDNFFDVRLACQYNFYNSIVHVKGYNAYGGGKDANGKVLPGADVELDLAFEYALSRHWALAIDLIGYWQAKSTFEGYPGTNALLGTPMTVAKEASIQYSIAPAIEYNWNENLGVIAGAWFTVAGKQISKFYDFIFAINYYK